MPPPRRSSRTPGWPSSGASTGFEGRSSLRTWVYRILVNTAQKRGVAREPDGAVEQPAADEDRGPTVDPALFRDAADAYPGGWRSFPQEWHSSEGSRARR